MERDPDLSGDVSENQWLYTKNHRLTATEAGSRSHAMGDRDHRIGPAITSVDGIHGYLSRTKRTVTVVFCAMRQDIASGSGNVADHL